MFSASLQRRPRPLGGPWSQECQRIYISLHAQINVRLCAHTHIRQGTGWNTVVAVKHWHSPSNMLKSVLISPPDHPRLSHQKELEGVAQTDIWH